MKNVCTYSQKTHDRLWGLLVRKVKNACDHESGRAVATKLGVSPGTVSRWISGTRGTERVSLHDALNIIQRLGVGMGEVMGEILPEDAEVIIRAWDTDHDHLGKFVKILDNGDLQPKSCLPNSIFFTTRPSMTKGRPEG